MKMLKLLFITLLCAAVPARAGLQEFIDTLNVFLSMDIQIDQFDAVDIATARFLVDTLEQKGIREKLDFCCNLFVSFDDTPVAQEYKNLQRELIMAAFDSIDMQQAANRTVAKEAFLSFHNPEFIEFMWTLVQEKESVKSQTNLALNALFLGMRLSTQVRVVDKPTKPVAPARDIVKDAFHVLDDATPDIHVQKDSADNPLADTVFIANHFTQAVKQEMEIEKAQKVLHAKFDRLESEKMEVWSIRADLEIVLEQHRAGMPEDIVEKISDYIGSLVTREQSIKDQINDAITSGAMLDVQKMSVGQEIHRWQPLFQQKMDQRIQQRMELERKIKAINEALDELKAQSKVLEQKETSSQDARRLLVASNMHEKLKEGAFNPKHYHSSQ